jgi:DNA-directed RNA polymerase specialized sigma24 family protein
LVIGFRASTSGGKLRDPLPALGPAIGGERRPYSEEEVRQISSRILQVSLAAGLSLSVAEDVVQDVWQWLLVADLQALALSTPWISAVTHNFVMRQQRASVRIRYREGVSLEAIGEPSSPTDYSRLEAQNVLDRIATALPATEKKLLALIRRGNSLAHAATLLRIPRGSRAYYRERLLYLARRELRACRTTRRPGSPRR